jgi:hypothetical protein
MGDAWSESSVGLPTRSDKARAVSFGAIVLGAALLVVVPLGGALLLAAGSLGLVISSEAPAGSPATAASAAPAVPTTAAGLSGASSGVSPFPQSGTVGATRSAVM